MPLKRSNYYSFVGAALLLAGVCCADFRGTQFDKKSHKNTPDASRNVQRTAFYEIQPETNEYIPFMENWERTVQTPRTINAQKIAGGVCYMMDNGDRIERRGGTIAWRNNNPGCIRYSSNAVSMGAIGHANGFAVFPDETTGMRALETLLKSENYRDLTIARAITKYAPPHENNTTEYINKVCRINGLNKNQKISDLSDSLVTRVAHTIRKLEGWHEGTEKVVFAPRPPELMDFDINQKLREIPFIKIKTL